MTSAIPLPDPPKFFTLTFWYSIVIKKTFNQNVAFNKSVHTGAFFATKLPALKKIFLHILGNGLQFRAETSF